MKCNKVTPILHYISDTPLATEKLWAILDGVLPIYEEEYAPSPDIDEDNEDDYQQKNTIMQSIIKENRPKSLEMLLDLDFEPSSETRYAAVRKENPEIVNLLFKLPEDGHQLMTMRQEAMSSAIKDGNKQVIELYLKNGLKPQLHMLNTAYRHDKQEIARLLEEAFSKIEESA